LSEDEKTLSETTEEVELEPSTSEEEIETEEEDTAAEVTGEDSEEVDETEDEDDLDAPRIPRRRLNEVLEQKRILELELENERLRNSQLKTTETETTDPDEVTDDEINAFLASNPRTADYTVDDLDPVQIITLTDNIKAKREAERSKMTEAQVRAQKDSETYVAAITKLVTDAGMDYTQEVDTEFGTLAAQLVAGARATGRPDPKPEELAAIVFNAKAANLKAARAAKTARDKEVVGKKKTIAGSQVSGGNPGVESMPQGLSDREQTEWIVSQYVK
jgi:Pyruvate/2-oxoacid:ferredoxin oxidoreductase gamma subunit